MARHRSHISTSEKRRRHALRDRSFTPPDVSEIDDAYVEFIDGSFLPLSVFQTIDEKVQGILMANQMKPSESMLQALDCLSALIRNYIIPPELRDAAQKFGLSYDGIRFTPNLCTYADAMLTTWRGKVVTRPVPEAVVNKHLVARSLR